MKRLLVVIASALALVTGLLVSPAYADAGQNCKDFPHHNGAQVVTVCVSMNFTHLDGYNNVHVQFKDGKGNDVYYLAGLDVWLVNGSNYFDEHYVGDLPIYPDFSDAWNQHNCLLYSTNQLWGYAEFQIEWDVGDYSGVHSVSSDFVSGTQCF